MIDKQNDHLTGGKEGSKGNYTFKKEMVNVKTLLKLVALHQSFSNISFLYLSPPISFPPLLSYSSLLTHLSLFLSLPLPIHPSFTPPSPPPMRILAVWWAAFNWRLAKSFFFSPLSSFPPIPSFLPPYLTPFSPSPIPLPPPSNSPSPSLIFSPIR